MGTTEDMPPCEQVLCDSTIIAWITCSRAPPVESLRSSLVIAHCTVLISCKSSSQSYWVSYNSHILAIFCTLPRWLDERILSHLLPCWSPYETLSQVALPHRQFSFGLLAVTQNIKSTRFCTSDHGIFDLQTLPRLHNLHTRQASLNVCYFCCSHCSSVERVDSVAQAVASALLDASDCDDPLGRCAEVLDCAAIKLDCEPKILGLSGDVSVDARAADEDDDDVLRGICLRKTRAGGNWLTGGILDDDRMI
jgi:hypothetical protein